METKKGNKIQIDDNLTIALNSFEYGHRSIIFTLKLD